MEGRRQVYVISAKTSNSWSVKSVFESVGANLEFTSDPDIVETASHVVVPGVGSFGTCVDMLNENSLKDALISRYKKNLPTFLICVGLQVCASSSDESPNHHGLGLFKLTVKRFPDSVRSPQQGWNLVRVPDNAFYAFNSNSIHAYYSNSYSLHDSPEGWTCYKSLHGVEYVAAMERGSWLACQFHPELSGEWGKSLIKSWLLNSSQNISKYPFNTNTEQRLFETHDTNFSYLTRRVVASLNIRQNEIIKKLVSFESAKESCCLQEAIKNFQDHGADEIVILDLFATAELRKPNLELIKNLKLNLNSPLTVGGGIQDLNDAIELLNSGADKIFINNSAFNNPQLINKLSEYIGKQSIVLGVDALRVLESPPKWHVTIFSGKLNTQRDVVEWCKEGEERGAGEILLNSINREGSMCGYDLELIEAVSKSVNVPVVAAGGACNYKNFEDALEAGADAVLASSLFLQGEITPNDVKSILAAKCKNFFVKSPC